MMRPSLCIATARAFGGRVDAVRSAVAIELLHNAFLVHDDIEDESEERRGEPDATFARTASRSRSTRATLMLLSSLRPLLDNRDASARVSRSTPPRGTERMARESAEGQAMELGWRRDNVFDLDEDDYLDMVLKKTCWLAAIYPEARRRDDRHREASRPRPFIRFGFFLGAAFQIQDDLLNLVADQRYGKECSATSSRENAR